MEQQSFSIGLDHISYSQITAYLQCPYLWAQRQIWRREQPVNDALLLGKAMHEALYIHCKLFQEQGVGLLEAAELAWVQVSQSCDYLERPLPPDLYALGLKMMKDAIEYGDLHYKRTLLAEHKFRVQLGKATVVGRIDRVDELAPDVYELVDYKTSWLWPTEEDIEKDLELAIYATAWREMCENPEAIIFVTLHNLRRSIKVRVEKSPESMDETWEYLQVIWERIKSDHAYTPTPSVDSCLRYGGCWASSMCPAQIYCNIPMEADVARLPSLNDEELYRLYVTMERWLPTLRELMRSRIGEQGDISLDGGESISLESKPRRVLNPQCEEQCSGRLADYIEPGEVTKVDGKKLENRIPDIAARIKSDNSLSIDERQILLESLDSLATNLYIEKRGTPKIVITEGGDSKCGM